MSKIEITIRIEELRGLKAHLACDMDDDPQWLAQFEARGEAAADLIETACHNLAERIRAEFDKADAVNAEVKALGDKA